jgi:acyl carrier protein
MTKIEMIDRLNEVFRDVFDDDGISVTEVTTAADIEDWDSLMHISLVSAVEHEFGIKFTMKEVLGMRDVGEMMDILEERAS